MKGTPDSVLKEAQLNKRLVATGFRSTRQREDVYNVLLNKRDHPTAEAVFIRAKRANPGISMATVYNCLDALVQCGLVREVNLDRGATRFCPNMEEHCHFYCDRCGQVFDVMMPADPPPPRVKLPRGFRPARYQVSVRGCCAACARKTS